MGIFLYVGTFLAACFLLILIKALTINLYWKKRGIPGPAPWPFVGNFLPIVFHRKSVGQIIREIYNAYPNEPVVGYYHFTRPTLIIKDTKLIERIFVKDFHHFHSRFGAPDTRVLNDPINANLFLINGNIWKAVRSKFAPLFATGRLRDMFPLLSSISDQFIELLAKNPVSHDFRKKAGTYTIDVIASTAFGIEPGPMENEDSEFRAESRNMMPANFQTFTRLQVLQAHPSLAAALKINFASHSTIKYFTDIIKNALAHRRTTGGTRNDFVQQMIAIQEKGNIEVEKDGREDENKGTNVVGGKIATTDEMLAGQAFAFVQAGTEATTYGLLFIAYDLAVHIDKQENARAEVNRIVESHGWSYDSMKKLDYLDACITESLRIHSPVTILSRMCTKRYEVPGTDYTVNAGEFITVPAEAIHLDDQHYERPTEYLPERWLESGKVENSVYLPWGIGPRQCTGKRFAIDEMKCAVAKMLINFKMSLHPNTSASYTPHPWSFFNVPSEKIFINFEKV